MTHGYHLRAFGAWRIAKVFSHHFLSSARQLNELLSSSALELSQPLDSDGNFKCNWFAPRGPVVVFRSIIDCFGRKNTFHVSQLMLARLPPSQEAQHPPALFIRLLLPASKGCQCNDEAFIVFEKWTFFYEID
jgi:hypothetical protein